ncbi:MAG: hypothetical protein ACOVOD_02160, partial [Rhodoferax sp.]
MAAGALRSPLLLQPRAAEALAGELRQSPPMSQTYILTFSCPDRLGLVHYVSGFLLERGGNMEEAAQYNDHDSCLFFMRVQF